MVCQRCISAVSEILLGLEIKAIQITLGKVQIENNLNKTLESKLNNELLNLSLINISEPTRLLSI